jgi:hypothetical protein
MSVLSLAGVYLLGVFTLLSAFALVGGHAVRVPFAGIDQLSWSPLRCVSYRMPCEGDWRNFHGWGRWSCEEMFNPRVLTGLLREHLMSVRPEVGKSVPAFSRLQCRESPLAFTCSARRESRLN